MRRCQTTKFDQWQNYWCHKSKFRPHALLSPSDWSVLYHGHSVPLMGWILIKPSNKLQAAGVGDKTFFSFQAKCRSFVNIQYLVSWRYCASTSQASWSYINIYKYFYVHFEKFTIPWDTRAAFSLPIEHARRSSMTPHWADTCWMNMGQLLQP